MKPKPIELDKLEWRWVEDSVLLEINEKKAEIKQLKNESLIFPNHATLNKTDQEIENIEEYIVFLSNLLEKMK